MSNEVISRSYLQPVQVVLLAIAIAIAMFFLSGCASEPSEPEFEMSVADHMQRASLVDRRGRFREIYCTVLEKHGESLPDYRSCEAALTLAGDESGATGEEVELGYSNSDYLVLLVQGLGWDCFAGWLDVELSAAKHVANFGYEVRLLPVDGLSSTEKNALLIQKYIASLPPEDAGRPIILAGYSKGAPDILTAVANYPEVANRVSGVISLAGSIGGSPLADDASQSQANMLTNVPGSNCDEGDEGAVESLRTDVRQQWLVENTLPSSIKYYSVVTYPSPERVSWGLKSSYKSLSKVDVRNDTQVLIYDQMIPGSTLVAFLNADHWAIAVPVARKHAFVGSTVVNHNDYPREALLEALLRFIEEDLSSER
jgi:hypothetical protein